MKVQVLSYDKFLSRLSAEFKNTEEIRGSSAFWTLNELFVNKYLSNNLINALCKKNSYICCDISSHITNIDAIDSIAKYGANFWVFSYKLSKPLESHPSLLLHSKILLLKQNDGKYLVFIGSHNMTNRALKGINTEHSLLIECDSRDSFILEIEKQLELIKNMCIKYNHNLKKKFKWLQDGVDIENEMFVSMLYACVSDSEYTKINKGNVFVFVSLDSLEFDHKNVPDLKERDRLLNLLVFTNSGKVKLFEVELIDTGTTSANNDSTKFESEGSVYFGLWTRSISYYRGIPIYCKRVSNLTGNVFDIDNTHHYKLKIVKKVKTLFKVNKGKDGFRSRISGWENASKDDLISFSNHTVDELKNIKTDEIINLSNDLGDENDKHLFESKILKINQGIFSAEFLDTMVEKNKQAFQKLAPQSLIDTKSETYLRLHKIYKEINVIIFDKRLYSKNKLKLITDKLFNNIEKYKKALKDDKVFSGTHVKYFRNMRDKFLNKDEV